MNLHQTTSPSRRSIDPHLSVFISRAFAWRCPLRSFKMHALTLLKDLKTIADDMIIPYLPQLLAFLPFEGARGGISHACLHLKWKGFLELHIDIQGRIEALTGTPHFDCLLSFEDDVTKIVWSCFVRFWNDESSWQKSYQDPLTDQTYYRELHSMALHGSISIRWLFLSLDG